MTIALRLAYRGGAYAGWQRQSAADTVQARLETALAALGAGTPRARAAGRTDAGVHASGQMVDLRGARELALGAFVHGTNHFLPEDIRVMAAFRMPPGFDARRAASAKRYCYRMSRAPVVSPLDAPFVARVDPRLDVAAMRRAVACLPGRHDWSAFALAGGAHRDPRRLVFTARLDEREAELVFAIEGEGFLRGMVRSLVGTLLEVGRGRRPVAAFAALLDGGPRALAGPTAAARGLVLDRVSYGARWRALEAFPPAAMC